MIRHCASLPAVGLFAVVFLPPLVFVVLGTASMSIGAALASVLLLVAYPSEAALLMRKRAVLPAAGLLLAAAVVIHLLIAAAFQPVNLTRGLASVILLMAFIFGSMVLAQVFFFAQARRINQSCLMIFQILSFALIIGITELIPGEVFGKYKLVFPFAEPSHFALAYGPFLLFVALKLPLWRRLTLVSVAIVLGYLLQNMTLLLVCLLVASIVLPNRYLALLIPVLITVAFTSDIAHYIERLQFSEDAENLSSLVYMQGWELLMESLQRSSFFGIGFQQLGERPTQVLSAQLIYARGGLELNQADGGFLAAKIISEFGAIGFLTVCLVTIAALRSIGRLKRCSSQLKSMSSPSETLPYCVVACTPIELFVRGTGYFSGTTLLLFGASWYLLATRRLKNSS